MTGDLLKEQVLQLFNPKTGKLRKGIKDKIDPLLKRTIWEATPSCESELLAERVFWVLNDLHEYPNKCETCGSIIKNGFIGNKHGYIKKNCNVLCQHNSKLSVERLLKTKEERYGKNAHKDITAKGKLSRNKTNIEKYGGISPFSSIEVQLKAQETLFENYGVTNPGQSEIIKERITTTWIENYGVSHPSKSQIVVEKTKRTNVERYNVDCYLHYPPVKKEIFLRAEQSRIKNFFKRKSHARKQLLLDTGEVIEYQGYENVAIIFLLRQYNRKDIFFGKDIARIKYSYLDVERTYYPDIFVSSANLLIEVKSSWTWQQDREKNMLKANACKEAGYNFEFWICSDKEVLEKIRI